MDKHRQLNIPRHGIIYPINPKADGRRLNRPKGDYKMTETTYILERFVSRSAGWVDEGVTYQNEDEAKEDLGFHKTLYPQERFRLRIETTNVIWRKEDA